MKNAKTFGMTLLAGIAMAALGGCANATDDETGESQDGVTEGASASCHSVRDDKDYAVGTTVVGKHDQLRCPESVRICLAPDSNYSSTCRADGSWDVAETGTITGL